MNPKILSMILLRMDFLVAIAALYETLSVGPTVGRSVSQSVGLTVKSSVKAQMH